MDRVGAWLLNQFVHEAHISESASSHDLVVTSTGSVRIEVFRTNTTAVQVLGSSGCLGDITGRRNMISGD